VMTSNLGASEQSSSLGFDVTAERRQQMYVKAAQQFFRPEFFNRLDEVVAFRNLDAQDMERIVAIHLEQVLAREGLKRRDVYVSVSPSAIRQVIQRGFDSKLGARAVRRMLESEIMGPLGDCLSEMHTTHPALVQVSHEPPSPRLACHVTALQVAQQRPTHRIEDLQTLLERGRALYDTLDNRLQALEQPLRDIDREVTGQTHGASYYALREQLYRSSELLKTCQTRLSRKSGPRLGGSPQAPTRPRRDGDAPGSRRGIKDWQAQQDLRAAFSEQHAPLTAESLSPQVVAKQLVDSLTVASVMIDTALTSRHWLIGFEPLTEGGQPLAPTGDGQQLESQLLLHQQAQLGRHGMGGGEHLPGADAFLQLLFCLQYWWQYDVSETELVGGFWQVSGVSLLGILRPLLGTYQIDTPSGASHLRVLRAVAVAPQTAAESLANRLAADAVRDAAGHLRTPAEQPLPTTVVRGSMGQGWNDWVSGAKLPLAFNGHWQGEGLGDRLQQWWIDCLPVPPLLRISGG
ncbi:MAG: ATP-dependent Clp protease ATP-binding subunit, partial [Planctomycetales bacterium]|nr:ATP-dependent Clp protease ATP-binding subunit [Planctomycetales bacterium]